MKQILNINLGGHPVTIDTDAYDHLSKYLDTIEKHFKISEATEEILYDIESRMAELFKENIHPRTIVTKADVNAAIDIMGTPEMFGANPIEEDDIKTGAANTGQKRKSDSGFRPGKRLFRDPEEKIIGGICSGLAAYLGIEDPIWVRIIFLVFTVAGFASIPIYLILWIAMPAARSSADKLAMKGEPINVESIANSVSEEIENLSEKFNSFGSKKKRKSGDGKIKPELAATIGGIISAVIIGIGHAARPFLRAIGSVLIIALILGWIAIVISSIVGISQASFYMPTNLFAYRLGISSLFLLLAAPIFGLILRILRIAFKAKPSSKWSWGLVSLWVLGFIGISYTAAIIGKEFNTRGTAEQTISLVVPDQKPLTINLKKVRLANNDARNTHIWGGRVKMDWSEIDFEILPAKDNQFKLLKIQKALGSNSSIANAGAEGFEYEPTIINNTLTLPSDYFIPKGERFQNQKVRLKLFVPIGQKIILDKNLRRLDLHLTHADPDIRRELLGNESIMTKNGLAMTHTLPGLDEIMSK